MAETFQYKQGTDSTHGANTIVHFYDRAGIKASVAKRLYGQFADRKSMPTKMGKTYKVSRWQHSFNRDLKSAEFNKLGYISSRDVADVSTGLNNIKLEEGAGKKNLVNFGKVNLECKLNRYGEMIEYTDEVDMFSEDYIQVKYREELGELAGQRTEDLIQLDMLSTNNVMFSGVATSLATMGNGITANGNLDDNYRVNYNLLRKAVQKLKRNRADKVTEIVTGSTKIDTRTVNSAYYAIVGPEVKFDLETMTYGKSEKDMWIPVYKYADASKIAEGEVGQVHEIRFIESETAMVERQKGAAVPTSYAGTLSFTGEIGNGAKFDVFPILFPTKGSFATVGLAGHGKIKFRSASPENIEASNPYGTKGWFSYNMWYAGIILKEECLLRLNVLASA